jgi:uncharacterized protein (TIGR03067 family)
MKRYVTSYIFLAGMVGAVQSQDASGGDAERLQGEWMLASVEVQGKALPAPVGKGGSIVFAKDGKLIMKDPGKPDRTGRYEIDAGTSPRQVNLLLSKDGKKGKAVQGIYEFDDDQLKMAFSADGPKGKRPDEFKENNVVIMHLKRQKS